MVGPLVYAAFVAPSSMTAEELDRAAAPPPIPPPYHLPSKRKSTKRKATTQPLVEEVLCARDSKMMTERARFKYFDRMVENAVPVPVPEYIPGVTVWRSREEPIFFMTCTITPEEIDSEGANLNTLSYEATAKLVRMVFELVPEHEEISVVADRLGHDADTHEAGVLLALAPRTPRRWTRFLSETKADVNHKGVSIASVVAKSVRDRALGGNVPGGGYPNAACEAWVAQLTHPDPRVRYSWSNVIRLLDQREGIAERENES